MKTETVALRAFNPFAT